MELIVLIDVMEAKFTIKLQDHVHVLLIPNGMDITVWHVMVENTGIHNLKVVFVYWVKIGMDHNAYIVIQVKYLILF